MAAAMDASTAGRLAAIRAHLASPAPGSVTVSTSEGGITRVDGEIQYSYAFPERLDAPGPWTVHRSALSPDHLVSRFQPPREHVSTLYENLETSVAERPEALYLGMRTVGADGKAGRYQWMTYAQAAEARTAVGSGLLHHGIGRHAKIGLYSVNCRDWVLVDAACHAYSMTSVPLYDTLGPDAVSYICGHAELAAVACSAAVLPRLLQALPGSPNVQLVVVFGWQGPLPPPPPGSAAQLLTLEELQREGQRHSRPHDPPSPGDLALLCYTSGTTGTPKGAMLTHANLLCLPILQQGVPSSRVLPSDVHISYLPLAHIYERGTLTTATAAGAAIGFYRGDILDLLDDVQALRPTIFYSVPRLYNRIYDRVMATVRGGDPLSRALFERAFAYKLAALRAGDPGGGRVGRLCDRLVFSKVRARLGGRVRLMVSGASPLGADVMDFLRVCFGAGVIEGYGLTESASCVCATMPEETRAGHVGGPSVCCEIKLADIPDMRYTNADVPHPRGEVCLRGPAVFRGYYKDEQNTREAIDQDGWFHTGDVGMWLSGGRLKLIDRKKAMFKLAQGEYVAAEKVENVHMRSPLVAQSFVYGDSLRSKLVAVVVPDPEALLPWAAARGLPQDLAQLCSLPAVRIAVLKSVLEEGRTAELRGFEQVAAVHLHPEPFSVDNDLQTPTFKLKRPQARERFAREIEAMYASISEG